MNMRRVLAMAMAGVMAVSAAAANVSVAWADGETVVIKTADDLAKAIDEQKPNQTWVLEKGEYVLGEKQLAVYSDWQNPGNSSQPGWYFPIHEEGITIQGNGATISSPVDKENANWSTQDFISVWSDNVKIDGLNIYCKEEMNKAIEVMSKNFTLTNTNIMPQDEENHEFSGSIFLNPTNDDDSVGSVYISNVTLSAWISASYASEGNVVIENTTLDFENNSYAGTPGYTLGIGDANGLVTIGENVTYLADGNANLNEQIFGSALRSGVTVKLTSDVYLDKMLDINVDNVTLDLGGNTLTASGEFGSTYENDSHLVNVVADGVTITNGSLVATSDNKHVLNIFEADNVTIGNLTLDHTAGYKGAPLVVNSSDVVVDDELNLVLGDESWYGINADKGSTSTEAPSLTFKPGAVVTSNAEEKGKPVMAAEPEYVRNPENAGLKMTADGIFVSDPSVIPPYEEDEKSERSTGDYFGNAKWAEVKREIAKLVANEKTGETIEMSATGLPWFPASVARDLKGHDITLEVRKNGVTYSINGLRIGEIDKIWYEFDQIETELLTVEVSEDK